MPLSVAIITDTLALDRGTGIARYTKQVATGLVSHGVEVGVLQCSSPRIPFGDAFAHMFLLPMLLRRRAHAFDIIHAGSPICGLGFPLLDRPKVVVYHDLVSLVGPKGSVAAHVRLFAPLFLRVGQFADSIIAVSSLTKQDLVSHLGFPSDKIHVVNPGVSEEFRPRRGPRTAEPVIGYVGSLSRYKRVGMLLESFRVFTNRYPHLNAHLSLCGPSRDGGERLRSYLTKHRLTNQVHLEGFVSDEYLAMRYAEMDIFVLPSAWEGFGLPILEAQRCGVPVVIFDDAHIPPEAACACVRARDPSDMADKLYLLLTAQEVRREVVEHGLSHSQRFTWETTIKRTLEVYAAALG